MSEGSFKRRLALLEEGCESERAIYTRQFSDFTKWCLVRIEEIFIECDRNLEKTRNYLQEQGLNTDEYFTKRYSMATPVWVLSLDIANVRKALGQKDWQQTNLTDSDASEVRKYYELIRQKMMSPSEALLAIASARTGTQAEAQNDMIDENPIDHSARRDGQEETSELVTAIGGVTPEAALAMTDVGAAAGPVVDAFLISMGANLVANLNQVAADTRANFSQITASIKNSPLD